jgi:hypothetical protein
MATQNTSLDAPIALNVNEFNQALGLSDIGLTATDCFRDCPISGAATSNFITVHFDSNQPLHRLTSDILKRISAYANTRHVAIVIRDGDRSETVAITCSEFDPEVAAHYEKLGMGPSRSNRWPARVVAAVVRVKGHQSKTD